jgi:hypothetical protein
MQAKALVKERAQRNLLLLIDGHKSEEMLIVNVAGIKADDFTTLEAMGLIEPLAAPGRSGDTHPAAVLAPVHAVPVVATVAVAAPVADAEPLDHAHFTDTLAQVISKELGLRGFTLTLAAEKAGTIQELMDVARRTIDLIRDRKGAPAAEDVRRLLYGN